MSAGVSASGVLSGTFVIMESNAYGSPCTVGSPGGPGYMLEIIPPTGSTRFVSPTLTCAARTTATNTYSASYSIDLAASANYGSSYPNGLYKVRVNTCCRVGGIVNMSNQNTVFEAGLYVSNGSASNGPIFNSTVADGIAGAGIATPYLQSLNADGTKPLFYTSLAGSPEGPSLAGEIINLSTTGLVEIPVEKTSTFTAGQYYVYRVQTTDPFGNYAQRDVLLAVTTTNRAPTISADLGTQYTVAAGASQTVNFSASDVDAGQQVEITAPGRPSWVTLNQTTGNPASGTLTISPPAGTPNSSVFINVDATDNGSPVPMAASRTVRINVGATPPVTTLKTKPANPSGNPNPTFTYESDQAGSTFECKLDAGAWTSCPATGITYTGLSNGSHTFSVRASNGGVTDVNPIGYTWTIAPSSVPTPVLTSWPTDPTTASSASFGFTLTSPTTAECKLDNGAWGACTSPKSYTGLADGEHTFYVRAKDGSNYSYVESYTWRIGTPPADTTPPTPPSIDSGPAGTSSSRDASFEFSGSEGGLTFECQLDGGAWEPCTSPKSYSGLSDGEHVFKVRATDTAGNVSPESTRSWNVAGTTDAGGDPGSGDSGGAPAPSEKPSLKVDLAAEAKVRLGSKGSANARPSVDVGCEIQGGPRIESCRVRLYARQTLSAGMPRLQIAGEPKMVPIGSGLSRPSGSGSRNAKVNVPLNSAGLRLLRKQVGGFPVRVVIEAKPEGYEVIRDEQPTRLVTTRQLVMPTDGLFAFDRANLSKRGAAWVRAVRRVLPEGAVREARCVGHTDSTGDKAYNYWLGRKRAKVVCAMLRQRIKASFSYGSMGELDPMVSNRTSDGRAANRRVAIRFFYK